MLAGTLEFAGTDRFRVIRPIGEGGMGMVFEAEDLIKGQLVAVKTLKGDDLETLYRLKREFRSLADLSHPNLVDLYEMFMDDDQCFITMELVEGTDFIRYCRPHDSEEEHQVRAFSRADTAPPDNMTMLTAQVSSHLFDEQRLRTAQATASS